MNDMDNMKDSEGKLNAYAGYCLKEDELMKSASGGFATHLSKSFIENGGIVYGAQYENDFRSVCFKRVTDTDDIEGLRGSKYCQTRKYINDNGLKENLFLSVIGDLKAGVKVLFLGLGCDIAALYKNIERENIDCSDLTCVELICDGVTDDRVLDDYIRWVENKYQSKVKDFTMRYKKEGWTPFYIRILFENETIEEYPFYSSDIGYAFQFYKKKCCYNCLFRGRNHRGDIVIGDYWGCDEKDDIYNKYGISLMIPLSDKGLCLLKTIDTDIFKIKAIDANSALRKNPRFYNSPEKTEDWNLFDRDFHSLGLHASVMKRR